MLAKVVNPIVRVFSSKLFTFLMHESRAVFVFIIFTLLQSFPAANLTKTTNQGLIGLPEAMVALAKQET